MSPANRPSAAVLDTYFKSYFWSFRLAVLAIAAFILAQTVNAFVGRGIAVSAADLAAPRASTRAVEGPKANPTAMWSAFLDRNVFKAAREDIKEKEEPEVDPAQIDDGPIDPADYTEDKCQKSALTASLITTIVTRNPDESVAVFQDANKKDIVVYRAGDRVLDQALVVAIRRQNVFVKHNGRCERFSLDTQGARIAAAPPPPAPAKGGGKASDLGKSVKKVNDGEYELSKGEIDNILSNLNKLATQARIVPSFRNGKANGFKLFSIRPNSLYAKIGIQNGDIIQKINGYEINSPDKALAIYSKLKDATNISVDLLRRGNKKSMNYNIR